MSTFSEIVSAAERKRTIEAATPAPTPPDYSELNRMVKRNKAAVTRAKNSGDPRKVIEAVNKAVDDFNAGMWPDDWPHFRLPLDDLEFHEDAEIREAARYVLDRF